MARINVESDAVSGDPRIVKRLPRFTGLSRFDALGRLVLVWGLGYARKSTTLSEEDIDDTAEHTGFADAMIKAELADVAGDGVVRVRGLEDRIGYLLNQHAAALKGGAIRREQLANSPRGERGKFVTSATSDHPAGGHSPPTHHPKGGHSPPDQIGSGGPPPPTHHPIFSGSGSGSSLDLDQRERAPDKPVHLALVSPEAKTPDAIERLWLKQEQLRAEVIPNVRGLSLTDARRSAIRKLLKGGYSEADLVENLNAYANEVRRNRQNAQWFNGETNWREANVARQLGRLQNNQPPTTPARSPDGQVREVLGRDP